VNADKIQVITNLKNKFR